MSSSVQPSDAVSSAKKKSKPGKAERAAKRASSAVSMPANADKAAAFAAGARGDPVAQPGRYPVVFSAGVGEPTRDESFALDLPSILSMSQSFAGRYKSHPAYAEFASNSELDDDVFMRHTAVSFLLGLCQQIVHSHVNMALPTGDFSPVLSTDLRLLGAFRPILSQFGEFPESNLGTRFLLEDYDATIRHLLWAADRIMQGGGGVGERSWLPVSARDGHTRVVVARALCGWLRTNKNIIVNERLEDAVFSGDTPDFWEELKPLLGSPPIADEPDVRDRFDFLFKAYSDAGQFVSAFVTPVATGVLREISLSWTRPSAGHMNWDLHPKEVFTRLADWWGRQSVAYARFFEMGSSLSSRPVAQGTMAQFATVKTVDVVTLIRCPVALSAPQLSLLSCFPPSGYLVGELHRNVVVTTSVPVSLRATEFCQQDWR